MQSKTMRCCHLFIILGIFVSRQNAVSQRRAYGGHSREVEEIEPVVSMEDQTLYMEGSLPITRSVSTEEGAEKYDSAKISHDAGNDIYDEATESDFSKMQKEHREKRRVHKKDRLLENPSAQKSELTVPRVVGSKVKKILSENSESERRNAEDEIMTKKLANIKRIQDGEEHLGPSFLETDSGATHDLVRSTSRAEKNYAKSDLSSSWSDAAYKTLNNVKVDEQLTHDRETVLRRAIPKDEKTSAAISETKTKSRGVQSSSRSSGTSKHIHSPKLDVRQGFAKSLQTSFMQYRSKNAAESVSIHEHRLSPNSLSDKTVYNENFTPPVFRDDRMRTEEMVSLLEMKLAMEHKTMCPSTEPFTVTPVGRLGNRHVIEDIGGFLRVNFVSTGLTVSAVQLTMPACIAEGSLHSEDPQDKVASCGLRMPIA